MHDCNEESWLRKRGGEFSLTALHLLPTLLFSVLCCSVLCCSVLCCAVLCCAGGSVYCAMISPSLPRVWCMVSVWVVIVMVSSVCVLLHAAASASNCCGSSLASGRFGARHHGVTELLEREYEKGRIARPDPLHYTPYWMTQRLYHFTGDTRTWKQRYCSHHTYTHTHVYTHRHIHTCPILLYLTLPYPTPSHIDSPSVTWCLCRVFCCLPSCE